MTTLYIKNMVCDRCITVLKDVFAQLGAEVHSIEMGKAVIAFDPALIPRENIKAALNAQGFELLTDKNERIVEQIKKAVLDLIELTGTGSYKGKNSEFIAREVGINYPTLSRLFSKQEGISMERFIILVKIQKTKEMLEYDELSLGEIAFRLGYSSVHHLSSQFKQVTGLTVSRYREEKPGPRAPLDKIG